MSEELSVSQHNGSEHGVSEHSLSPRSENEPVPYNPNNDEANAPKESMLDYACGFFHWDVLRYMCILCLVGVTTGYAGGMTGPWLVLQEFSEECSKYETATACYNLKNQDCVWKESTKACDWRAGSCRQFKVKSQCPKEREGMKCSWDYGDKECKNTYGYTSLYNSIFGSAPMVMQIFLGLFVGDILVFLRHRNSFMLAGMLVTLGSVMQHVGVATNEYWASAMGRFCLGFGYVFMAVPGMVYVNQNAPPRYKQVLVSFYAVVNNFGQFLPAAIGGALGLSLNFKSKNQLYVHLQLNCMFCTLLSVAFLLMGYFIKESPYWKDEDADSADDEESTEKNEDKEGLEGLDGDELLKKVDELEKQRGIDVSTYSWWSMAPRLLIGIVVAGVVQLTGISAFGNYAPIITERVSIKGLEGSMLIQAWNTISASMCLVILGITSNLRLVMLTGTLIAAIACLVVGILICPGVIENDKLRNGISIAGIALYILAFQSCIAGAFYPLAQEMFPLSFRPRGSSFMNMFLMLFSFTISVFFPIALTNLSGGPGGDQNKGMAIIMLFFSGIAFIGFVVMFLFLQPWTAKDEQEVQKQKKGVAAANSPDQISEANADEE